MKHFPSFINIFRHPKAIPQYTLGHQSRLDKIASFLEDLPGLIITGNAFKGILFGIILVVIAPVNLSASVNIHLRKKG